MLHADAATPRGRKLNVIVHRAIGHDAETARIAIAVDLPSYPALLATMDTDAAQIALALTCALPQGTLDRLAVILARRLVSDVATASNPRTAMRAVLEPERK
jgi:hypothetical protein